MKIYLKNIKTKKYLGDVNVCKSASTWGPFATHIKQNPSH